MNATAGDTPEQDGEAHGRPAGRRTARRRAPDTVTFWGAEARIPVVREPSPVLGSAVRTVAAPAAAPTPAPSAAPAPAPASAPVSSTSGGPRLALQSRPAPVDAVVPPGPRRNDRAPDGEARRIRPRTVLGAAGLLLLVGGLATPFLLRGPFGAPRDDAAPAPARTGTVTTYVPTVSGSAPVALGTAASTVVATAPTSRPATAARRTTAAATGRTGPTVRRTTVTVTATAAPTTTQPSTRPGEVFVDPAQYLGRPEDPVRAELEARGLDTADSWAFDTGRPRGTVVEVRPSGWVRDGGDVRVYVAWS